MTRNSTIKIVLCLSLFCLGCCFLLQLFYSSKIKDLQQSSVKLQQLLSFSDDMGSKLGSVQYYFRSYLLDSSSKNLEDLKNFQAQFHKASAKTDSLSKDFPTISIHVNSISELYNKETEVISQHFPLINNADSKAIIKRSEEKISIIWTLLGNIKSEIKVLLQQKSNDVIDHLETMQMLGIVSLLFAFSFFTALYFFYSSFRKTAYQAGSSQKSNLTNKLLLMRSLLDTTTTLMYIIDLKGKYLFANKSFLDFFGLRESDVLGRTFHQLDVKKNISFRDISIITNSSPFYLEQEEEVFEDDKKLYFFTRKFPIKNDKDEVFASGVVCRNITERILNEEGLKKSRYDAEQAKLTQEQFMANISHEIRTPMNGIIGMTHLLSHTSLNEEQQDYLQTIQQSSQNLMILINDILDFSKIEAGKLELEHIPFKVTDIIEQVSTPLRAKIIEKNLQLNIKIDHKVPSKIIGDPLRLNQILTNILSNAIKFTSQGSVNLTVSAVSYNAPLVKLIFKIEDSGIGIPPDRINYIFQSFAQSSLDITRKFGGTGLGLAIVKQLVDLHSGNISVESEEKKGSIFTIEIPYKSVVIGERSREENSKFELLKGKKVLVVEDNFINQKVIVQTLKNAGIETALSDNGFTALDMLKSDSFDLVIMDIQMPEIDGCETTVKIREELKLDIPVIAMTASAMQEDRDKCKTAGMNEFISKPFVTEDLLEKMLLFIN